MATKSSVFSFFAGVGFLDLGFELTKGHEVVFVNEYIDEFVDAFKYSREQMGVALPKYGFDVLSVDEYSKNEHIERIAGLVEKEKSQNKLVGFIAGPPCPDFSVGGKNRGMHGENGRLSAIYADMIIKLKPDYFLFENVKGLWRTKKHRDFFNSLKKRFHEAGYVTTENLVNARTYGVAQDRDRIILLGFKKEILDGNNDLQSELPDGYFDWNRSTNYSLEEVKSFQWPTTDKFKEDSKLQKPNNVPDELTVQYWFDKNDTENHLNAADFFTPRAALSKFKVIEEGDDKKKSYKRLHRWRYSPTCAYGNNEVHLHPYKARRLSVSEALSLQSLPKDFVLPPYASLSAKFKMIGNGVPFVLSKSIADDLLYFLDRNTKKYEYNRIRLGGSNKPTAKKQTVPLH